jgi:phosphoglucomutase
MHGVGLPFVQSVLSAFNFPADSMHVVPEQAQADPNFTTVRFPNPEEKGALDMAMALGDSKDVKLVFANDPDADRFSVAEKDE